VCAKDRGRISLKTSKEAAEIAIQSQLIEQHCQQSTFLALKTAVGAQLEIYKMLVQALSLDIIKEDTQLKEELLSNLKHCRAKQSVANNDMDAFARLSNKHPTKFHLAVVDYLGPQSFSPR
jgi:hypothetical protein